LAVCPVPLNIDKWDTKEISEDFFVSPEIIKAEGIDESNEVFFAGLFAQFVGAKKNIPIVRHGKIAMMPDEPINFTYLFLVDVLTFGGNSGSPVFVKTGGPGDDNRPRPAKFYLLGVMDAYFNVNSPVTVQTGTLHGLAAENTGVAAVVPAQKIEEILRLPNAVACNQLTIATVLSTNGRLQDAYSLATSVDLSKVTATDRVCSLGMSSLIEKLSRDIKRQAPQKAEHLQTPESLWWRSTEKTAVSVKLKSPNSRIGMSSNLFLLKEDGIFDYFLVANDTDAQGVPLQIAKDQILEMTYF
jgi:hypothetical protein